MSPMTTLGERIQQAMNESGETFRSLAKKLHISSTTLHDWVKKPIKISDKKLDELGKHTNGKPAAWFRYGDQEPHIDVAKFSEILAAVLKVNEQFNLGYDPKTIADWASEIYRIVGPNRRVNEDMIRRLMTVGRK